MLIVLFFLFMPNQKLEYLDLLSIVFICSLIRLFVEFSSKIIRFVKKNWNI